MINSFLQQAAQQQVQQEAAAAQQKPASPTSAANPVLNGSSSSKRKSTEQPKPNAKKKSKPQTFESDESDQDPTSTTSKGGLKRRIPIQYIQDKSKRHVTFSKRKAGIMKKAYELSTLTGTQTLLLIASETGHVYTFATPKLQPIITGEKGKKLIQSYLNADDDEQNEEEQSEDEEEESWPFPEPPVVKGKLRE